MWVNFSSLFFCLRIARVGRYLWCGGCEGEMFYGCTAAYFVFFLPMLERFSLPCFVVLLLLAMGWTGWYMLVDWDGGSCAQGLEKGGNRNTWLFSTCWLSD